MLTTPTAAAVTVKGNKRQSPQVATPSAISDVRSTATADKAYDTADFVAALRDIKVTPQVAQNTTNRRSAVDGRTTHHSGYAVSQRIRKRIEEVFGWTKTSGGMRKTRHRGKDRRLASLSVLPMIG